MSPSEYKKLYTEFQTLVEKKLSMYITEPEPVSLYEPFRYFISDCGKRIRPVLAMICAGAVGGKPESAVDVGTAIEILHNFTLVNDDIMDKSPMRRNRPTVHTKWNEPVAILVGDVMVGYAYKLLPSPENHSRSGQIIKAFTDGLIKV
ncbi:MAG: polyprenyl synthetase family protein, partial [FCB group bacterium]